MPTVDSEAAFGLFYELLKAKPWLLNTGRPMRAVPEAESGAIAFLLQLAAGNASDWGNLDDDARDTASALLMDFFIKLRQPNSPLSGKRWEVAAAEPWQQALEIVARQLRLAHPRQTTPH